ncbi:hypothetical protein ACFX10_003389 [Malus domestica]
MREGLSQSQQQLLDGSQSTVVLEKRTCPVSRDDSLSLPPVRHLDLNTSTNKLSKPSKPRFPESNHKES